MAKLSPGSRAVLRLCAWYADTPIPRALVMDGAAEVLALAERFGPVMPLSGPVVAELRMRDALTGLARYSMILDAIDTTFRVHGLVQTVERVRGEDEGLDEKARDRALVSLAAIFPNDAYRKPALWPGCRALLPHLHMLLVRVGPAYVTTTMADLLATADKFLDGSGDTFGPIAYAQKALEIRRLVLGDKHLETLASMNNVAACLEHLGKLQEALQLFRRTRDICEQALGTKHRLTLLIVSNIALCVRKLGDPEKALPLLRHPLKSREEALGAEDPDTLTSMNDLAGCMHAIGHTDKALPLLRLALDGRKRVLGADHPHTLNSMNDLAGCVQATGDAHEALPLFRQALESRERVLNTEHPNTFTSANNLALCLQTLGDIVGALLLYRRALGGRERVLGSEHLDTLKSMSSLAGCMHALGDTAGALPLFRRVLDSHERVLGKEHPDSLTHVGALARLPGQPEPLGGGRASAPPCPRSPNAGARPRAPRRAAWSGPPIP